MNRINDNELEKLHDKAIVLYESGYESSSTRSIAISNIIIIELLTRLIEK